MAPLRLSIVHPSASIPIPLMEVELVGSDGPVPGELLVSVSSGDGTDNASQARRKDSVSKSTAGK